MGPCEPQEGHCSGQGVTGCLGALGRVSGGTVRALGRVLREVGHHQPRGHPREGVTGSRVSWGHSPRRVSRGVTGSVGALGRVSQRMG